MAKRTLLEMVQSILSSMGSDEVNNIADTHQATRIVKIIREVYEQEAAYGDWPHLKFIGQLEGLGDSNQPTVMKIPTEVNYVDKIRYEEVDDAGNKSFPEICFYEDPQDFLDIVLERNTTDTNVEEKQVPSVDNVKVFVYNDRNPTICTTFDDEYLVFDAYDNTVGSTLIASKSLVNGKRETTWTDDNAFVPDLPSKMFPYLLSRATVVANERLAEKAAVSDRQAENRGRNYVRRNGGKTDVKHRKKKYGRK